MSLKILGGRLKGRKLPVLEKVRPTKALLKRKVFDRFQDLTDLVFVDLFAGSGSLGLEALSRGADPVYFVERSRANFLSLEKVIKDFDLSSKVQLFHQDALKFLDSFKQQEASVIFYLDPPYEQTDYYKQVLKLLAERHDRPTLWLESDDHVGFKLGQLEECTDKIQKVYRQGANYIAIIDL